MRLIKKNIKKIIQFFFSIIAKSQCKNYISFKAFGYTHLTKNTFLGKNVNFNGFKVLGKGKVTIGDNFHSGKGCSIITQVHNYKGESLPYDDTYIIKDTIIERFDRFKKGANHSILCLFCWHIISLSIFEIITIDCHSLFNRIGLDLVF